LGGGRDYRINIFEVSGLRLPKYPCILNKWTPSPLNYVKSRRRPGRYFVD